MTRPHRPAARAAVASTAALAVALTPAAALAGHESVRTTITKGLDPHLLIGEANVTNLGGGMERWDDFYNSEQSLRGPSAGLSVCNYQGGWKISNPDGTHFDTNYTRFHGGCSYAGYFHSTATDGDYVENKRFTSIWKSDYTNGSYTTIGSFSD
ncbi:MAG TPA: hypothetical protein VHK88_17195 [Aquihabitans sp.]|jgi:hypothetical protein|nr:hypothetical protein [Aquihabitans sp.]